MAGHHVEHEHGDGHKHAPVHHVHGDVEHIEHHHHRRGGKAEHEASGGAVERDEDRPEDKRGGHVRRPRRARGGGLPAKQKVNTYNAQGSPEVAEAEDEREEFGRGGRKRKAGGMAEGEAARRRGDRAPRGRHAHGGKVHHEHDHDGDGAAVHHHGDGHGVHHHGDGDIHMHRKHGGGMHEKRARGGRSGGSPFSSGRTTEAPKDDPAGRGHEGLKVPAEPF